MAPAARDGNAGIPKSRKMHHSYDESADEAARLIDHEPVEVEAELPADENPSIEGNEQEDEPPSAFVED
jgi:hypothetical protein